MLYRPFESQLNVQLAKHDLYRAQWSVLHYLATNGSATLVELAHYQRVEKPTVTRTVTRLEELNYLEHIPGKDRREKRVRLSPLGESLYKEVRLTVDQFEQEILKGISEKDQLAAIQIMKEIRSNLISKETVK
ncbi:MarR family winged helix-turn-helix transcriptional regulator [Planococcus salinus]|nr:MarR family transcriptional regulator [Planococcus salinus]